MSLFTEYVAVASANLNKSSKWYEDDLAAIRKAARRKSDKELRESIAWWKSVAAVTENEIRRNCQV